MAELKKLGGKRKMRVIINGDVCSECGGFLKKKKFRIPGAVIQKRIKNVCALCGHKEREVKR